MTAPKTLLFGKEFLPFDPSQTMLGSSQASTACWTASWMLALWAWPILSLPLQKRLANRGLAESKVGGDKSYKSNRLQTVIRHLDRFPSPDNRGSSEWLHQCFCEESDVCKLYNSLDDMQLAVYAMFGRCIQRCLRKPSISSMCMTALLELRDLLCAGG